MSDTNTRDEGPFKVPVSCLADFVSSPGRSVESLLRPYKYNRRGEGAGRSGYYRPALNAVRKFHSNGNDEKILDAALLEFQKRVDDAPDRRESTKFEKNIRALELYRRVYRNRKFEVLPNHRLVYRLGQIVVTAQPDLWVRENGTDVLLKVGMAKKQPSYVDILLTVIRKAAVSSGYRRVRSKNVVYLNVSTGREMICKSGLVRFNRTFKSIEREIVKAWPNVSPFPRHEGERSDSAASI